jgi:hypothetical protein
MSFRGGEFSTGTMGNFQPELTRAGFARHFAATSPVIFPIFY